VFGPLQPAGHAYAAVVPTFVRAALAGEPLPVEGDGHQTRDFTFVGLVVSVVSRAVLERVSCPGPVNLAAGWRTSLLGLAAALEAVLGRPLARRHLAPRPGDVRHSQADTSRLRTLFGPLEPPSLEEGLRQTVGWWRAQLA
jgi:UDP-glucose 4-epimerase